MKILAVIPARGGSKRLKNKNILKVGKKSLVIRTIEFARKIPNTHIIVSTDSKKIAKTLKDKINIPWLRPRRYALDNSSSESVALHALRRYEKLVKKIDGILLLQPTTPFRNIKTLIRVLKLFKKNKRKNYVSVSKTNGSLSLNGSFYLISSKELKREKSFVTKNSVGIILKNRKERIDIDTISDLKFARSYL